jgi:murein DD-endopeptidase MepM/ murein hydrolase activator NlpD
MEDVETVVTGAEKRLTEILGYNYSLDGAISVSADLGVRASDTKNLQNAILGGVRGVSLMYVLDVNGRTIGAVSDRKVLDGILSGILREYATDATSAIRFTDAVTITAGYVSGAAVRDPEAIRALLEPSNTASAFRLTVESTELRQLKEDVPYEIKSCDDSTIYTGTSIIRTKGVFGEKLVTQKTICINGVAQTRETVGIITTKAPVAEVVAMGTLPRPKTASHGTYIWPTEGVVTSGFGPRTGFGSSNHKGIDVAGDYGESIVAADGGQVIYADWCSGYGLFVQIRHDNGDVTCYGHCSELLAEEGQRVAQGQVIAHMGATGVANGVHVHFELRKGGAPVNPAKYLP